jgi:hypothetical protein
MATTYTWAVVAMKAYPEQAGYQNVVCGVNWTCAGVDGNFSYSYYGGTSVELDPNEPFIPYDQLTEDEVIGWVQSALGPEGIAEVYAEIDAQIASQQNAPTSLPLPWTD